ncbi:unnamed protein product [Phytophthora lilii]|uniref:Unnamed protein product n=1 Tax=Phytophthora lilii TaxID=2077276 RepID=A0A9W6U0C6_9STRA|nr:unnamed protein product [Phytophthora lilii]
MLVAAEEISSTRRVARNLEGVEFRNWADEGKTVDNVFELLKLNLVDDNLLSNPVLSAWSSYARKLGKNPDRMLFTMLKNRHTDEALTRKLVAAKSDPRSRYIAQDLELIEI